MGIPAGPVRQRVQPAVRHLARSVRAGAVAAALLAASTTAHLLAGGSLPGRGPLALASVCLLTGCWLSTTGGPAPRVSRPAGLLLATLAQLGVRCLLTGAATRPGSAGPRGALAAMSCAGQHLCAPAPSVVALHAGTSLLLGALAAGAGAARRRLRAVLAPLTSLPEDAAAAPLGRPARLQARWVAPRPRRAHARPLTRRGPPLALAG